MIPEILKQADALTAVDGIEDSEKLWSIVKNTEEDDWKRLQAFEALGREGKMSPFQAESIPKPGSHLRRTIIMFLASKARARSGVEAGAPTLSLGTRGSGSIWRDYAKQEDSEQNRRLLLLRD